jgi:hypothetical protein
MSAQWYVRYRQSLFKEKCNTQKKKESGIIACNHHNPMDAKSV